MHTKPMSESDGKLSEAALCQSKCPKCGNRHGNMSRQWDSDCGGYTDFKLTCWACHHVWWIEGGDS